MARAAATRMTLDRQDVARTSYACNPVPHP
jgi:hypothetical protein